MGVPNQVNIGGTEVEFEDDDSDVWRCRQRFTQQFKMDEEVAALRREVAEHNAKLMELVKQRLDLMDVRSRQQQRTHAVETPPLSPKRHDAEAPETFCVQCLSGPGNIAGTYRLQQGRAVNGYPVWKQETGNLFVHSLSNGMWAIGSNSLIGGSFDKDASAVYCPRPHLGMMPDKFSCDWEYCAQGRKHQQSVCKIRVSRGSPGPKGRPSDVVTNFGKDPPPPPQMPGPPSAGPARSAAIQDGLVNRDTPVQLQSAPSRLGLDRQDTWATDRASRRMTAAAVGASDYTMNRDGKRKKSMLFADKEGMKQALHKKLLVDQQGLRLKTQGIPQAIVKHKWFDYLTLTIITLNAGWIGYEVDQNPADALPAAPALFQVIENMFCAFFTFEVGVRLAACANTWDAFKDWQFIFDLALVLLMIFETWLVYLMMGSDSFAGGAGALSMLRMLRLSRMCRLARLFRAVPELMVLVKGISVAFRSMFWTLVLLFMVIYVFAVAFNILAEDSRVGRDYFYSVPASMGTLLLPGLLPDAAATIQDMSSDNVLYAALFLLFIVTGVMAVQNMLIGVMVEGVSAMAAVEKEANTMTFVKAELGYLLAELDRDKNAELSREEIAQIIMNPEACRLIQGVGVDVEGLVDVAVFQLFQQDKESATFPEFVELVLQLRGTNSATVRDVVNLRKFITEELENKLETLVRQVTEACGQRRSADVNSSRASDESGPSEALRGVADLEHEV